MPALVLTIILVNVLALVLVALNFKAICQSQNIPEKMLKMFMLFLAIATLGGGLGYLRLIRMI